MSIYYDQAQRSFEAAQRSYDNQEPPYEEVDGKLVCCDCEEVIPGDAWYFEVEGKIYCEDCMKADHMHLAPFADE